MIKKTIQIDCTNPCRFEFMFSSPNKQSLSKRRRDHEDRISKLLVILEAIKDNTYSQEAIDLFDGNPPYNWVTSSISKSGSQLDFEGEFVLLNGSGDSVLLENWLIKHKLLYKVFVYVV